MKPAHIVNLKKAARKIPLRVLDNWLGASQKRLSALTEHDNVRRRLPLVIDPADHQVGEQLCTALRREIGHLRPSWLTRSERRAVKRIVDRRRKFGSRLP